MLMDFFSWGAALSKSSPVFYGFVVMLTMSFMGVSIAIFIDLIFRLSGIELGYYKKEFEDQLSYEKEKTGR